MITRAVDPGLCTGYAWFRDKTLIDCGVTTKAKGICGAVRPDEFIIEMPMIYPTTPNPNDIVTLAADIGWWEYQFQGSRCARTWPTSWKGQVPKEIHHTRLMKALTAGEAAIIPKLPKTKLHNCLDAVALGMWKVGRMGRGGTAP